MTAPAKSQRRSILTPVAYSEALMPSLQLARSSRQARRIAVVLLIMLLATIGLMMFAPWQQTITGEGYVVAYAPSERQQTLEATIKGRIVRWNPDLVENSRVAKGDFIAEIRDKDNRSLRVCIQQSFQNSLGFFVSHGVEEFVNQQDSRIGGQCTGQHHPTKLRTS